MDKDHFNFKQEMENFRQEVSTTLEKYQTILTSMHEIMEKRGYDFDEALR